MRDLTSFLVCDKFGRPPNTVPLGTGEFGRQKREKHLQKPEPFACKTGPDGPSHCRHHLAGRPAGRRPAGRRHADGLALGDTSDVGVHRALGLKPSD